MPAPGLSFPRAFALAVERLRPLLVLASLLSTFPLAHAEGAPLFVDPAGDAGPGSVPIAGAFDHADLLRGERSLDEDAWHVTLHVASLPPQLPPDTVWGVEWNASGATWQASWAELIVPSAIVSGAYLCHGRDPTGAPTCDPISGARLADGFRLDVPLTALGDGALHNVGAMVMQVPEATAWPTFVVEFTGANVLDLAEAPDLALSVANASAPGERVDVVSAGRASVPGTPIALVVGGIVLAAFVAGRRLR